LNLALRYATHIVALKKGQIAFEGKADMLLDEARLSELYESPITLIDHPTPADTLASRKVAVVCA
jgi:iron complex transport system ATP-binding protein